MGIPSNNSKDYMEKVKRYNQVLLAILGTLAVAGATLGLIAFAVLAVSDVLSQNGSEPRGVVADSVARDLSARNLRKQLISYHPPEMIDSANNVYLIPVGLLNLEKPERTKEFGMGSSSPYKGSDDNNMAYNNLLVHWLNTNQLLPLFKDRIAINAYYVEKVAGDTWLLIEASSDDTNRDGILNQSDLENLYVYALKSKQLHKINLLNASFIDYFVLNNDNDLMIRVGLDRNKDGSYNYWDEEPTVLYQYALKENRLTPFVNPKLADQLQKLLEGQKLN